MNKFLSNLLIGCALGLCALCALQWYRETRQREEVMHLTKRVFERDSVIQTHTNSIHIMDGKIAQLESRIGELRDTVKTNDATILQQKRELTKLESIATGLTNQIEEYKAAVDVYQARLKEASVGIERQNELIKSLGDERNELVNRLNESTKERNDIVQKYNELVKVVEELHHELTNAPPAKPAAPARNSNMR
jgi:chromosome segregation ATPase